MGLSKIDPKGPKAKARAGRSARHGLPHSTVFAVFEKRAAFFPSEAWRSSNCAPITVESSAVENSTPGLPFRVAGSKGERLPTLYPEHLARRRRRVPGAALGTVSPAALFPCICKTGIVSPIRAPGKKGHPSMTHSAVHPRCREPFRT